MKLQTISIIGLDRVGVSLGLALKAKLGCHIIGYDTDPDRAQLARKKLGAIDTAVADPAKAIAPADILLVTVPLAQLEALLQQAGQHLQPHALLLDFSPYKGLGLQWASQHLKTGHYLPVVAVLAEPWLADGRRQPEAATADLWQNSLFCLLPAADTHPQAIETATSLGRLLGARPYFIDAAEYDALVQGSETLPALLGTAVFKAVHQSSSWSDLQRFASQAFALATLPLAQPDDIALMAAHQKAANLHWLQTIIDELQQLHRLIAQDEPEILQAVLAELSQQRAAWLHQRQENDWEPPAANPLAEQPSMMGHILGGFSLGSRRKKPG